MLKKTILLLTIILFGANFVFAAEDCPIQASHDKAGIYVIKLDTKKLEGKIKPYVAPALTTTSDLYKTGKYELVVNGGFFNIETGAAVSYVNIDGKTVETPFSNMPLILSLAKDDRLEKVLNRAELRILEDGRKNLSYDIKNHFESTDDCAEIKHSLQGGPILIPGNDINKTLEKESFIKFVDYKVVFQSADVLKKRERTILGLKDDDLYIIIFTKQNPVTMQDAQEYCKKLRLDTAMALDGGASTSLNYNDIEIYSNFASQRKVKSFLVVEK